MRTEESIKKEIISISNDKENRYSKTYKMAEKRVAFLRKCILYIKTSPNEFFVQKQLDQCNELLEKINAQFPKWCDINRVSGDTHSKLKSRFSAVFEIKKIKDQITYLEYILNKGRAN